MIKYTFLLVSILFCSLHLQAQFILLDKTPNSDATMPTIETTRSAFLAMNEALQMTVNRFIFTDLVQQTKSSGIEDGKFYFTPEQFYEASPMRKLQIIQQPDKYIVVAKVIDKTPIIIKTAEFETYSPEKQKAIREDSDYIITQ